MKKSYDSKFKSRVALEALRRDLTVAEIAGKYQIHPNLVQQWKKKLQESDVTPKIWTGLIMWNGFGILPGSFLLTLKILFRY